MHGPARCETDTTATCGAGGYLFLPGASAHRLAFTTEEALRLASLPGENEGRSYYFRRLHIAALPANGDRSVWLARFQSALTQSALEAVHGADPRAALSPAVYFRGEQEAVEILLHRILARRVIHEWFWPMVASRAGFHRDSAGSAAMIVPLIERLRAQPASWTAVAAALFSTPACDAIALLDAIPQTTARNWVRELEGGPAPARTGTIVSIPPVALPTIQKALQVAGVRDVRTIWLAALAIVQDSPSELFAGTAVWRARAALQHLSDGNIAKSAPPPPAADSSGLRRTDRQDAARSDAVSVPESTAAEAALPKPADAAIAESTPPASAVAAETTSASAPAAVPADSAVPEIPPIASPHADAPDIPTTPDVLQPSISPLGPTAAEATTPRMPQPWQCEGLPTTAAGLFFLLNALQRIGISQALAAGLAEASPNFSARVLRHLAAQSGVASDDPIALWLDSLISRAAADPVPCVSCCPSNLRRSRDSASVEYLTRAWSVAARRWCWRNAGVSVREIVGRKGVFSVNRTDLDVSLPLDKADIRIRRVGLDLDPGWLPWFGRVVRFHYLFRGEFHG